MVSIHNGCADTKVGLLPTHIQKGAVFNHAVGEILQLLGCFMHVERVLTWFEKSLGT